MDANAIEKMTKDFLNSLDEIKEIKKLSQYISNKNSSLLERAREYDEEQQITKELLLEFLNTPSPFNEDEDGRLYVTVEIDGKVEEVYLSSNKEATAYERMCDNIIRTFPELTFSLDPDGSASKKKETISIYRLGILNLYLNDRLREEIDSVIEVYDFENMRGLNNELAFTDLFNDSAKGLGKIGNMIILCANSKIATTTEKKDTSWIGILGKSVGESIRTLAKRRSDINYVSNLWYKNNKNASKKERYNHDEDVRKQLTDSEDLLNADEKIAFAIFKQDTSAVPDNLVKDIEAAAIKVVSSIIKEEDNDSADLAAKYKKQLKARGKRQALRYRKLKGYLQFADGERDIDKLTFQN